MHYRTLAHPLLAVLLLVSSQYLHSDETRTDVPKAASRIETASLVTATAVPQEGEGERTPQVNTAAERITPVQRDATQRDTVRRPPERSAEPASPPPPVSRSPEERGGRFSEDDPCGADGKKSARGRIGTMTLLSGDGADICGDGTVAAPRTMRGEQAWWRMSSADSTWKNPRMSVCLVPLRLGSGANEAWHNVIGILAPYAGNELNYAISLRRDGNLVIKKEVKDYGNLSKYTRITKAIPLGTPIGMVASVVQESDKRAVIRSWVNVGSCTVDTSRAPDAEGFDERSPRIPSGALVLRTDYLSHRVLAWNACESSEDGRACKEKETQFVPIPR